MKKTGRNQNMPDKTIRNNESANTASSSNSQQDQNKIERFGSANLDQHATRNTNQQFDDSTGTVENKRGKQ